MPTHWRRRTDEAKGPGSAGAVVAGALVLAAAVGRRVDHVEVAVKVDVDLAAVVEGDPDLVVALFVADLALGHLAAARLVERDGARVVERVA